jgi:scabin-like protein
VHGIGDAAGEVKDFTVDTAKGVGDFAVGMKDVAVMGWHLSPVYGVIDPEGQQREYEMLGQGAKFAWEHPGEFAKAMVDWDDIANGHPGRAFGQMLPNIVLTVATAGGGAAAKGATTVNAVSKMSKATKVADDVADAGKASKVVEGAASHADDLPPVTYRGDARTPEEIFETGFQPRGTSTDLEHYALTNDPSAFVGTSKSSEVAAEFAGPGGYHYVIRAPDGIDVNATLGSRSPFPYEQEVVFQGGINTEHVVGAHPVGTNLELGDFVHNPHHPAR